jgi:hypothetical protein
MDMEKDRQAKREAASTAVAPRKAGRHVRCLWAVPEPRGGAMADDDDMPSVSRWT